jgi:endonuclease V-like protein UPF0215 family
MTPERLRQIKKEIRVLGVAARRSSGGYNIIGIVYRGSLWLDGVMRIRSVEKDITDPIVEMLTSSPHYGQVRVILLSRENLPLDISVSTEELSTKTERPIIFLGNSIGKKFIWRSDEEELSFSSVGLSRWSAESVLRKTTRHGVTPEALRLAALTLSALTED